MNLAQERSPNFDAVAGPYRWLEYLSFGRALERCRFHFLPSLSDRARALVFGDGDGRFMARLFATNPTLAADAVDTSAAMLALLRARCAFASERLNTEQANALAFTRHAKPHQPGYDLVVTHFFLDCLTQTQLESLTSSIVPLLAPNARWLVSEFRIPRGPMQLPARVLVRSLYFAFWILTGLHQTDLPDYAGALARSGLIQSAQHHSLFGILTTELWVSSI